MFSLLQCPHNVHKLDSYMCDAGQVKSRYLLNVLLLLLLLYLIKYISLSVLPLFLIISTFFLPLRVVVMEVAVRPEMASAELCGATVGLDWI